MSNCFYVSRVLRLNRWPGRAPQTEVDEHPFMIGIRINEVALPSTLDYATSNELQNEDKVVWEQLNGE